VFDIKESIMLSINFSRSFRKEIRSEIGQTEDFKEMMEINKT
jgi:hypothetical protein